jgi:Flp pilus assembly protein TadD
MIAVLLAAAAAVPGTGAPPPNTAHMLAQAAHAIHVGRLNEARLIIARSVAAGADGAAVGHLIADLAFASGRYDEALKEYQALARTGERSTELCENGATAALKLGRTSDATAFAICARSSGTPSWRAWNICGVLADLTGDWASADDCYAKAIEAAPGRPEALNNLGWSRLLRGDWSGAVPYFRKAAAADPQSRRISNNLDLAQAALAANLPGRRPGETYRQWAERLNDAGVAADLLGERQRAISAFTQALYASGQWYSRAAGNLQEASRQ